MLNRIQSVVFETAYKTNENLLICAPTGAGKTNIAMLTILHVIQQHISQGVIKKDEFKVSETSRIYTLFAQLCLSRSQKLRYVLFIVSQYSLPLLFVLNGRRIQSKCIREYLCEKNDVFTIYTSVLQNT